tara:strand:- start:1653 stop:1907 length:255 start_codon:yes stop_codon:yes gene_type:complete
MTRTRVKTNVRVEGAAAGFVEVGCCPIFTYTEGLLTSILFNDSKTKTLEYVDGVLSTTTFFNGDTTITKSLHYVDGILTNITET